MHEIAASPTAIAVRVRGSAADSDCELVLADNEVTIAEVLEALELPSDAVVDATTITAPGTTLAATVLTPGSTITAPIRSDRPPPTLAVGEGVVSVAVVGGLDAGASTELAPGLYRIDPAGQGTGWYLEVGSASADTSSRSWSKNAHSIETVRDADFVVACSKPIDSEPGHRRHVHRPPRADLGENVDAISLTDAPPPVATPAPLSWATLLAPIPVAVLMAIWFRPIFAIFAAMGPIMALGRWGEARRRFRRANRDRSDIIERSRTNVEHAASVQAEQLACERWVHQPHVAELWRRTRARSVRMWERRPAQPGYLCVTVGIGPDAIHAIVDGASIDSEVHGAVAQPLRLRNVPHHVDLVANEGLGICGQRAHALAVARSLILQLSTLQGPADLAIGVLCSEDARLDWDWLKWLPHCDAGAVSTSARNISTTASWRRASDDHTRTTVMIVDDTHADVALLQRSARSADAAVRFIAISELSSSLPAACSSVVAIDASTAVLSSPQQGAIQTVLNSVGVSAATATSWARSMRALVDPEVVKGIAEQTGELSLLQLTNNPSADDIAIQWAMRDIDAAPTATVGQSADGPVTINLATDGPHGLIAGTTGSGKSEFLRTLIFSLALGSPPEYLNFVLVDFKGGGAFDACHELPHIAGLITDLDEALVERAISSLRAELQRREVLFRNLGVSTFEAASRRSAVPIARLVVVIDEFAALATDYPDMMASVIDLASRGRSLGMHLILATQRPSGVVDQKIRANTNLRIALRVQDGFDSQDVVGVPDAASLNRNVPGQAIMRIGGDPALSIQSAYTGGRRRRSARCDVRELALFPATSATETAGPASKGLVSRVSAVKGSEAKGSVAKGSEATGSVAKGSAVKGSAVKGSVVKGSASTGRNRLIEREVLTDLISNANRDRACEVRPLWSPPLPSKLTWESLASYSSPTDDDPTNDDPGTHGPDTLVRGAKIGLVDTPELQSQAPWRWDPGTGALALYGASAACLGKSLVSLGVALVDPHLPSPAHLYIIDGDAGTVLPLANLAQTGAYVSVHETDRVERTIALFESTLKQRRTAASPAQPLVLLIDNIASVLASHDELAAVQLADRLGALARDGAPHGLHLAVSARTARDIPHRLAQQMANRLVYALADPTGYLTLGLQSREVVALPRMRAIDLALRQVVQMVEPPDVADCQQDGSSGAAAPDSMPLPIHSFPTLCSLDDVDQAHLLDGVLSVPIGIEGTQLGQASLVLHPDEHAVVIASNGMGRSTTLLTLTHQLAALEGELDIVRIAPRRSPLASDDLPGNLVATPEALAKCVLQTNGCVVLVDDARFVSEATGVALRTLAESSGNVKIIAATSPDYARSLRAWTTPLRHSGTGILLGGSPADGDLFGTRIVRVAHAGQLPGRGHLFERGKGEPVQLCTP